MVMKAQLSRENVRPKRPDREVYNIGAATGDKVLQERYASWIQNDGRMEKIAEAIGAIRKTATQQQIAHRVKEMAEIFHDAAKAVFGVKVIPGEGRLKAHSQKVTRAAEKKDRWVCKVNKLKKAGAPYALQKQAEDKRREARRAFKKALWEGSGTGGE